MPPATAALDQIFLGRTPILDRDRAPFGFEFFAPDAKGDGVGDAGQAPATADVVCKMFAEIGLANALGTNRAFIPVDETLFSQGTIDLITEKNVVLQIDAGMPVSDAALAAYRALRERGYELCMAGVRQIDASVGRLLGIAAYIKVDTRSLSADALRKLASELKAYAPGLIAANVESEEIFSLCRDSGFRYFQGYFFAKPVIVKGRKLDPSTQTLFQLLDLLHRDADTAQLENAFKCDPALSVNLLRLTNSVSIGATARIASIRQAVTLLGRKQLHRWLQLLVFAGNRSGASIQRNPLMQLAAMRARFMEILAERCFPTRKDLSESAFLCGLLSLMPAALGISMVDVLANIAVSTEVRRALSMRDGELGLLLDLTERYDDNDRESTHAVLCKLGGRMDFLGLGECLGEVIAWVVSLGAETTPA